MLQVKYLLTRWDLCQFEKDSWKSEEWHFHGRMIDNGSVFGVRRLWHLWLGYIMVQWPHCLLWRPPLQEIVFSSVPWKRQMIRGVVQYRVTGSSPVHFRSDAFLADSDFICKARSLCDPLLGPHSPAHLRNPTQRGVLCRHLCASCIGTYTCGCLKNALGFLMLVALHCCVGAEERLQGAGTKSTPWTWKMLQW